MKKGQRKGFTLIELLVVISIIALLMSMLMPALSRVRDQAKGVVCLAQLRQWATIFEMYTNENNGKFQESLDVGEDTYGEYYQDAKLKLCPKADKTYEEGARDPFAANTRTADPTSYGINSWIISMTSGNRIDEYLWKTPNVKRASEVPVYGDMQVYSNTTPFPYDEPPSYPGQPLSGNDDELRSVCGNRHNGGVQWLFADWSVRKVGLKELWDLHWHRKWVEESEDAGEPDWPEWMDNL